MKIVLLIPSLDAGGAERQVVALANGMSRNGHDVALALFRCKGGLLKDVEPGVRVIDLKKGGKADIFGFLVRTCRLLRRDAPQVLYTFLGVPNLVGAALKPLLAETRLVWSVRASDMDLSRYTALARMCYWLECRLSRVADLIISNSEAGRTHALGKGFSPSIALVANGVDAGFFKPDPAAGRAVRLEWAVPDTALLVGIPARLDPMKDHPTFFHAAAMLAQRMQDVRFAVVGTGPDAYARQLEDLTNSLGLQDKLVWTGRRQDMVAVYNALDICCLASSFGEGFPNVVGEAMACGTPCVVTDVGDSALLVRGFGLVVEPGNPKVLAEALKDMADKVRSGMSPDVRSHVLARFSVDEMVRLTEASLDGLL